jgi:RNA polymerase sigma-70 factor (ECF subfamily)
MTKEQEQALIARAAAGERAAADLLIRHHQGSVYAYILRMCGRTDLAEDVVQEAFVRVLTNLDRFDIRFRFSTWLFTIARRVLLNTLDKKKPTFDSDRTDAAAGAQISAHDFCAGGEARVATRDALSTALMDLSLEQREIILLFHQHEWPIWLIAEHLSMPEGTIKSHLHRGRARLRELLADNAQVKGSAAQRAQEAWL